MGGLFFSISSDYGSGLSKPVIILTAFCILVCLLYRRCLPSRGVIMPHASPLPSQPSMLALVGAGMRREDRYGEGCNPKRKKGNKIKQEGALHAL